MATSTAPISDTDIAGVIGDLQAAGATITAEAVYQAMRVRQLPCRRSRVQAVVRAWRQQQQEAADVAPSPIAPTPPVPTRPYLEALEQEIATEEDTARRLERERQQRQDRLAQKRADYRNGVLEVQRLAPLFCRAYQQLLLPLYRGDEGLQREVERLRQALVRLVGEATVERLKTDSSYRPSWLAR